MPLIVVTRLRLKDAALQDEFFTDAVAAIEQAQRRRATSERTRSPTRTTPGGPSPPGRNAG
jgi:hypothetical protein